MKVHVHVISMVWYKGKNFATEVYSVHAAICTDAISLVGFPVRVCKIDRTCMETCMVCYVYVVSCLCQQVSLSAKEEREVASIAGMGFPAPRVARAVKRFNSDRSKVRHSLPCSLVYSQ